MIQTKKNNVVKLKEVNEYDLNYFSNLNLSNIDLSNYKEFNKSIRNSNLFNTGLKIKIDNNYYTNCDLRGCTLLYSNKDKTIFFNNVLFDEQQIELLNNIYNEKIIYDYQTILKNDKLYVSSLAILNTIKDYLTKNNINRKVLTETKSQETINIIELILSKDKDSDLKTFYYSIKNELTNYDIINMFTNNKIENITIRNLVINDNMYKIYSKFNMKNIKLENVTFLTTTKYLFNSNDYISQEYTEISNVSFPNISMEDYNDIIKERFNDESPFTFKKNLYLELGRICNGKCFFCRNNCFNETDYNLENILTNLENIYYSLDEIVIGGGEPTLKKHDLLELLKNIKNQSKCHIFTNGSIDKSYLYNLLNKTYVNLNISRHSFLDEENANIFKINKNKLLTKEDISKISRYVTLACTCFKGGIDSVDKIFKYLEYVEECNVKNVLFSNLQNDASVTNYNNLDRVLETDESLFKKCIDILIHQGYKESYPVISTGGYILYILKNEHKNLNTIVFKKYISKQELLTKWPTAVKRTFDFSMSPNGDIYANWSETGNKIKTLRKI